MKVIRETIVAGQTVMTRLKANANVKTEKSIKRRAKSNPTPEKVKHVNLKNAIWHLAAILNNNFKGGDYHLTLTYSGEAPTKEKAKSDRQKFLRNIKSFCEKRNMDWKWIAVTEYENHRVHHHIVCSGIDVNVITAKWKCGHVNIKLLDRSGEYSKLAEYLIKETEKTFRMPDSVNKKRYSSSGSIVIPVIKREEVTGRVLSQELKPYKGYYIARDTVRRYEHAILEVDCVEYIQVSLTDSPRIKRWNKGKKTKKEKRYKELWSEQLEIELDF